MIRLLAVDPGTTIGWALFQDTTLVLCGTVRGGRLYMLPPADELVIEQPRMRRRHPRPDDVLKLAKLVGEIVARYPRNTCIAPETWKGQLLKDVCWARVLKCLWPGEVRITEAPIGKLDHNVRDAIGIGLFHLGRFTR